MNENCVTKTVLLKLENCVTKTEYVTHIRDLKQALHGSISKIFHRWIKFNQKASLKWQKWKNKLGKTFSSWWIVLLLKKIMENLRKQRNIKDVTTLRRGNYLVSEPSYHATNFFKENLLAIEMVKSQIVTYKPVYVALSILDLSKTVTYEFWYNYVKSKYGENIKHCYMDEDSYIVRVKIDDVYKDISENIETRFDSSNFEVYRSLPERKNKKSNWTNERWIRWTNQEGIFCIKSKSI